jgi:hypothetical protein
MMWRSRYHSPLPGSPDSEMGPGWQQGGGAAAGHSGAAELGGAGLPRGLQWARPRYTPSAARFAPMPPPPPSADHGSGGGGTAATPYPPSQPRPPPPRQVHSAGVGGEAAAGGAPPLRNPRRTYTAIGAAGGGAGRPTRVRRPLRSFWRPC